MIVAGLQFSYLGHGLVQCSRDLYGHDFSDTWFLIQRVRAGQLPLWLPSARMGQPFLALLYTQVLYPPRVITALLAGEVIGPNLMHAFHAGLAFCGGFLAARKMGLEPWAAFIAAAPFSLGPSFVVSAENLSFASSAAWAGLNLWAALRLRESRSLGDVALLAATMTGATFAGAPEMVLWQAVMVMLVAGWRALAASAWAAVNSAAVLLPAAELAREYTDGHVAGQLEWSASWVQLLSMALPTADRPRAEAIWGGDDQYFWASLFIGSITVILAARSARERIARPLVALTVLCLVLVLGNHFVVSRVLLQLPVLNVFRYPAKYAAGAMFGLSMLSGVGAQAIAAEGRRRHVFAAAVAFIALSLFVFSHVASVRSGFQTGALWALCMALVFVAVSLRYSLRALAVLVAFELIAAPRDALFTCSPEALTAPSPVAQYLRTDGVKRASFWVDREGSSPVSVPEVSKQRLSTLRFIEEDLRGVGGYGFRDPWRLARAFERGATAYALAGVSHFVGNADVPPPVEGTTLERTLLGDVTIRRAPLEPFARSWFVGRVVHATDAETLAALSESPDRFRNEVLTDERPSTEAQEPCVSTVALTEPQPENLIEQVDACSDGFVVLAGSWYPGWQVRVDGAATEPFRANYFVQGVAVGKGAHVIEWQYRPRSFRLGAMLSTLGLIALAGVGLLKRALNRGP